MMDHGILVAEDHEELGTMLRQWLLAEGQIPFVARTLEAANAEILARGEKGFAVALVDVRLPDGNGLDLVKKLTALSPATWTVVMTALDELTVWEAAKAAGANDFIGKPFSLDALRATIDEGIEYHESLKQVDTCIARADRMASGATALHLASDGLRQLAD